MPEDEQNEDLNLNNEDNPSNQNPKEDHKPTKKVADTAAKAAATYFGGGAGGAIYDAAKKAPVVGDAIDGALGTIAEAADKIPGVQKLTKKFDDSGLVDVANQAVGSLGGKGGGATGGVPKGMASQSGMPKGTAGTPGASSIGDNSNKLHYNPDSHLQNPLHAPKKDNQKEDNQDSQPASASSSSPQSSEPKKNEMENVVKNKLKTKAMAFIAANPWVLGMIGGVALIFLIIIMFTKYTPSKIYAEDKPGLYGYENIKINNVCENVTVINTKNGKDDGTYSLEEYIAGVIKAEIRGFDNSTMYEVGAIAARTYGLMNMNANCIIAGNATKQAFIKIEPNSSNSVDQKLLKAANDTKGLVLTKDGQMILTQYDAFACIAKNENFYTIAQKNLQIPIAWIETRINPQTHPKWFICNGKENLVNHHGNGMSQYGAYYLITEENYTRDQVLSFFYGNDIKLMSIYEAASSNYTNLTSVGTNDQLIISLKEFLNSKGLSIEAYNEYILKNVLEVGFSTREAVVRAATSLVSSLYQYYGARIPYTMGGLHGKEEMLDSNNNKVDRIATSFYGVHPNWGIAIHNNGNADYYVPVNSNGDMQHYPYYGPDCSGFVSWAIHNAGFNNKTMLSGDLGNLGTKTKLNGTKVAIPGDLIWHTGHIMLVVGVDEMQKVYYVAEASGKNNGVIIRSLSFSQKEDAKKPNYAVDMTKWYNEHKLNITKEEFIQRFRDGYIDGYTGTVSPIDIPVAPGNPSKPIISNENDIYWVGDSRTVGLCYYNDLCNSTNESDTNNCLAKIGMGYNWLNSEDIKNKIKQTTKNNIIINMGINDVQNANIVNTYFNLFKELASSLPNKSIYIMSINPVGENKKDLEPHILKFNQDMASLINESGINNLIFYDTYNAIEYVTTDGLHYNRDTYKALYNYVIEKGENN